MRKPPTECPCSVCGINTYNGNYYMVLNSLWRKVSKYWQEILCIPCLEQRLGRELNRSDFAMVPLNINQVGLAAIRLRNNPDKLDDLETCFIAYVKSKLSLDLLEHNQFPLKHSNLKAMTNS